MEKESREQINQRLTPLQYRVTQLAETEPAFDNEFYNFEKKGVYKWLICHRTLFTSEMKYDSGCGCPAFNKQLETAKILKIEDRTHGVPKIQLRCSECNSHLGHLFQRKGQQTQRYCVNSASLIFSSSEVQKQ